jgi:NDP-sugar pyrophosphorylase family protein
MKNRHTQSLANLDAVILAGGKGTRLRSVVGDRPKVLAEVCGRPFLAHLLDRLVEAEVRSAVLSTGYLAHSVQAAFGASYRDLPLTYCAETELRGTGGALRLAVQQVASDAVLVMNGDSICRTDLLSFFRFFEDRQAKAAVVLVRKADVRRYGQVHTAPDGRVLGFVEKGEAHGAGWINAGVYLFRREVLEAIPDERPVSLEREVFPALVGQGFVGYRQRSAFLDIGTPESYRRAEQFMQAL